jgi:monofunctional biosynthetic peptidoglycan transglycosylase
VNSKVLIGTALTAACLCGLAGICDPGAEAGEKGAQQMIVDFSSGAEAWRNIDDVVMGGRSSSEMVVSDGVAVFRGEVSLENYGGFASVRSAPQEHDLSSFDGVVLRLRGDGKRYRFRLRTTPAFDGVSYQAPLEPAADTWQEIRIPFGVFEPVFRGRQVPDHPPLDPAQIKTFGLLISDKQAGPFRLEIEWINGYREPR